MNKRLILLLRILSIFCIAMAIGAMQVSMISGILMLVVGFGCLPSVNLALGKSVSLKFRAIVLVVLTVLALSISQAELEEADAAATASTQATASEEAES